MPLSDLSTLDIGLLLADLVVILGLSTHYYSQGTSFGKCRKIEISQDRLDTWRFFLYSTVITSWLVAYLIFVVPSSLRHVLHLYFLIGLNYLLMISLPAYICKIKGYGGTCNCDFYGYHDFKPMIILGIVGNLLFAFPSWDIIGGSLLFGGLLVLSFIISEILPEREITPLSYPSSMLITEIDELQQFLMTSPHEIKLLVILDAKCDFCKIQVDELMRVDEMTRQKHIRIFDLTFVEEIDPIIPMTLNMSTTEKVPVPTTFIFDSGMAIEQKDGVLSKTEIDSILIL